MRADARPKERPSPSSLMTRQSGDLQDQRPREGRSLAQFQSDDSIFVLLNPFSDVRSSEAKGVAPDRPQTSCIGEAGGGPPSPAWGIARGQRREEKHRADAGASKA